MQTLFFLLLKCVTYIYTDILKKRTHDVDTKRKALSMLESAGSFKFTVDYLRELRTLIFAELAKLNGNAALEQMLRDLCKLIE